MSHKKKTDILEIAVHVIIVMFGLIILILAERVTNTYFQAIWVNIGSSLVVVTILFFIFELFRRRHSEKDSELFQQPPNITSGNNDKSREARATETLQNLQRKQTSVVTTSSKVDRK